VQVTVDRGAADPQQLTFRVVQARFGGPMEPLLGKSYPLIPADPINGCSGSNVAAGAFVLMQRGGCYFSEKMSNAQAGGSLGVLLTDNQSVAVVGLGSVLEGSRLP